MQMKTGAYLALILTVLMGCALPPSPVGRAEKARVRAVYLYQHSLNVEMSDGQLCTAQKPAGATLGWSGTLAGCAHPLAFRVTLAQKVNPLRMVLEEVGLSPVLAPVAQVTLTEASGREVVFASPPPET